MAAIAPLSKRLKEARKRAGLNQHEVGVRAGIIEDNASAKINQYEQGVHIPRYPRAQDLARALNVPTAYFYAESDDLAELLYYYQRASHRQRQVLLKQVQQLSVPSRSPSTHSPHI